MKADPFLRYGSTIRMQWAKMAISQGQHSFYFVYVNTCKAYQLTKSPIRLDDVDMPHVASNDFEQCTELKGHCLFVLVSGYVC